MNLKEAKRALDSLAGNKYRSIGYEITIQHGGDMKQECSIYVEGVGSFKAAFWETIFADLQAHIDGRPAISEDL